MNQNVMRMADRDHQFVVDISVAMAAGTGADDGYTRGAFYLFEPRYLVCYYKRPPMAL